MPVTPTVSAWPNSNITGSVYSFSNGDFVGGSQVWANQVAFNNIYAPGQTIDVSFFQFNNPTPPNHCIVYDYDNNVVVSAAMTYTLQLVGSAGQWGRWTIAPPIGGFKLGNYRVVLSGPTSIAAPFGTIYGTGYFNIVRSTTGFGYHGPGGNAFGGGGESRRVALKGYLGMGTSRLQISQAENVNPSNPTSDSPDSLQACRDDADATVAWMPPDPARPWPILCQFRNRSADNFIIGSNYCQVYAKDSTVDGSTVYVSSSPGTATGSKIRVYYPDATTIVETFDNIPATYPAAETAINGVSNYIHVFQYTVNGIATSQAPTLLGSFYRNGVIATVNDLYTNHGVTRFEGPFNEPSLDPELAHQMKLFQGCVHNIPGAIATGPCAVDIVHLAQWKSFFDAGGGNYCDEISTHMYSSQINGDFNSGRWALDRWFDFLSLYDLDTKTLWDTESLSVDTLFTGFNYTHNTQFPMLQTLLREQYGFPREFNPTWYDGSHGFWDFPSFFNTNCGVMPIGPMYRVLAEETWGMRHHHAIDFGSVQANHIFLGSVYKHITDDTGTVVVQMHSALPGATVTFGINPGVIPVSFTVIDRFGNASTVATSASKITMPVSATPTYLRLPAGTSVYVDHVNSWPSNPSPSVSGFARGTFSGSQPSAGLTDGAYMTDWLGPNGFVASNKFSFDDTIEVMFDSTISTSQVICTFVNLLQIPNGEQVGPPTNFDVQTTADGGSTWTTRVSGLGTPTISYSTRPANSLDTGSTYEVAQDFQWIFDVPLGATYSVNGVRLVVHSVVATDSAGLPHSGTPRIWAQEISVISADTPTAYSIDSYATVIGGETGLIGFWRLGDTNLSVGAAAVSSISSPTDDGTYGAGPSAPSLSSVAGPVSDLLNGVQTSGAGGVFFSSGFKSGYATNDTFSLEFWMNKQGQAANSGDPLLNTNYFNISESGSSFLFKAASGTVVASTSSGFSDSAWHHIVVTKTGSTTKFYIDGSDVTVVGTNVTFGNSFTGNQFNLAAGTGHASQFSNLSIYTAALSAGQVRTHYYAATQVTGVPVADPQFNKPLPVVTGTPAVGEQMQCSQGHWANAPNLYGYQWQQSADGISSWTNVASASTRSDIIISGLSAGFHLRCQVTATNLVGAGTPQNTAAFLVPGTPVVYDAPPVGLYLRNIVTAQNGHFNNGSADSDVVGPVSTLGLWVRCVVTANNHIYHVPVASEELGPVLSAPPPPINPDLIFPGSDTFPEAGITLAPTEQTGLTLAPVVPVVGLFPED